MHGLDCVRQLYFSWSDELMCSGQKNVLDLIEYIQLCFSCACTHPSIQVECIYQFQRFPSTSSFFCWPTIHSGANNLSCQIEKFLAVWCVKQMKPCVPIFSTGGLFQFVQGSCICVSQIYETARGKCMHWVYPNTYSCPYTVPACIHSNRKHTSDQKISKNVFSCILAYYQLRCIHMFKSNG